MVGDRYLEQLHGHQLEATPLEALDDIPHQPPLHRVRLHQHQRLLLQLWGGCAGTQGVSVTAERGAQVTAG